MKYDCKSIHPEVTASAHSSVFEPNPSQAGFNVSAPDRGSEDDRYPGTFFRIPGVPVPGKTTWTLNK
ncbi:MAG: hypothetical protein ACXWTH_08225 [Methylosarcina sp.]